MNRELLLQPFTAMMLLTFVVWLRLYFTRIPELRRQRVHPQKLATRAQRRDVHLSDAESRTSDNFMNLFELPVLFYALCLAIVVMDGVDPVYLVLAWTFVALRAVHSAIHVGYNRVTHRFAAYVAGGAVLLVMTLRFAIGLV